MSENLDKQYKAINWDPKNETLPVSEIFTSIQGEGKYIGCPRVFVRLAICNLHCEWCDTRYTWDPQVMEKEVAAHRIYFLTPEQIVSRILPDVEHCGGVVFTGGEPLLHEAKIIKIVRQLDQSSIHSFITEVETNGTIEPTYYWETIDMYNVSPKLSNNNADDKNTRIVPDAMDVFRNLAAKEHPNAVFKFVITKPEDIDEMERDYIKPFLIPKSAVILMPEGVTSDKLMETGKWLVKYALEKGYRYTPRLQVLTFGNRRGT